MYNYIKGIVASIESDYLVLDNNDIGYIIYTPHPLDYRIGEKYTLHTYYYVKEDGQYIFGFKSRDERNLFFKLIGVKGVGPKTANNILSGTDVASFIDAVDKGNINFLKKLPGIGPKSAQQLIVELRGRFDLMEKGIKEENSLPIQDARAALIAMGITNAKVDDALAELRGQSLTTQEYIKKALAIIYARG